jgi:DNA-binding IclR family transcriptional regulator
VNSSGTGVSRVSSLLKALSQFEPGGATTTQIAAHVGLPRPTTHRLLAQLMKEGLVDRAVEDHRWALGPEIYLMGAMASNRYDVGKSALPTVRRLAERTGDSAYFSARRGNETVCLVREDGSFPIRTFVLFEGVRFPLGVASAGVSILAYLDPAELERYLDSVDLRERWGETYARDRIEERLVRTRRDGFSTHTGLIVPAEWGMSAAVFDARGVPRWALTLGGVQSRFSAERHPRLGSLLLQEAHRLTQQLSKSGIGAS